MRHRAFQELTKAANTKKHYRGTTSIPTLEIMPFIATLPSKLHLSPEPDGNAEVKRGQTLIARPDLDS